MKTASRTPSSTSRMTASAVNDLAPLAIGLRNVSLTRSALLPACLEAATELRQNPAI